ncbi:MAG TPA: HAMP domain-containing sensor histidine kinase [Streptosporangiaceae bacterium]|nr:HAMP domain-containing sensor histidine kinase [Streptosporangiaceae bacterium]
MPSTSWPGRSWGNLRRLPGRTPLRVKMITALLALVVVALMVISAVSLTVFRSYLEGQADQQVTSLYNRTLLEMAQQGNLSIRGFVGVSGTPYILEVLNTHGQVLFPPEAVGQTSQGPAVPTSKSWLSAHSGQLTTVPGRSGSDNWQVITKTFDIQVTNAFGQAGPTQTVILVVGMNLGNIDSTIGWLARIDLLVSAVIVLALLVVGVAIVRASLRPLTDIEQTAEAIAAGDLSRRVPDRDPRTEVGRLGRSLNTMLAQIESSFRARTQSEAAARRSEERMRQFVADASHELRTPLTAMRGYAEYYRQRGGVRDDGAEATPPPGGAGQEAGGHGGTEQNGAEGSGTGRSGTGHNGTGQLSGADLDRIMQRVEQESARMGVLVEDMLLLARLDQQRPIERRPVDLLTLAADAVQDARIIAPGRAIDLSVGTATAFLVLGDEVRLRQVIGNLMSNALTHTPDGTPVTVRILAGPRQPVPAVVLEVTDQGPGMPPDQAERVFERFYRADQARTRKAGGTGLGLAIVAALVAAHGGTVALQTAPGQGATFRITLPLAPEAQSDQSDESDQVEPPEEISQPGPPGKAGWPGPAGRNGSSGADVTGRAPG